MQVARVKLANVVVTRHGTRNTSLLPHDKLHTVAVRRKRGKLVTRLETRNLVPGLVPSLVTG